MLFDFGNLWRLISAGKRDCLCQNLISPAVFWYSQQRPKSLCCACWQARLTKTVEDFMRCENVLWSIQSFLEDFQANSFTILRTLSNTPKCSFFQISLDVNQSLSFLSPPTINFLRVALKTYLKRELRTTLDNQCATIKYQCNVYPLWIF